MINKVILVGRLGKDPEVKSTPSGETITKFTMATGDKFTDRNGNEQDRTEWHNIVVWGKLADICGRYLRKGKLVYIEGRIKTDSWEDKETKQKRYRTDIIANEMKMLGSKSEEGGSDGGSYDRGPAQPRGGSSTSEPNDEEVPF